MVARITRTRSHHAFPLVRAKLAQSPLPNLSDINGWENIEHCLLCLEDEQFNLFAPQVKSTSKENFVKEIDDPVFKEMEKAFQSGDTGSLQSLMGQFDKKGK